VSLFYEPSIHVIFFAMGVTTMRVVAGRKDSNKKIRGAGSGCAGNFSMLQLALKEGT
jgi:hypothetical protein